jgi:hypothetical protein
MTQILQPLNVYLFGAFAKALGRENPVSPDALEADLTHAHANIRMIN